MIALGIIGTVYRKLTLFKISICNQNMINKVENHNVIVLSWNEDLGLSATSTNPDTRSMILENYYSTTTHSLLSPPPHSIHLLSVFHTHASSFSLNRIYLHYIMGCFVSKQAAIEAETEHATIVSIASLTIPPESIYSVWLPMEAPETIEPVSIPSISSSQVNWTFDDSNLPNVDENEEEERIRLRIRGKIQRALRRSHMLDSL